MNVIQTECVGKCHRQPFLNKNVVQLILLTLVAILTIRFAYAGTGMARPTTGEDPTSGRVVFKETGFNVMNVQLVLGSALHFSNPTKKKLDIRVVTWRGKAVKELSIAAHGDAIWKPKHYGVYDYFNAGTTGFGSVTIRGSDGEKVYQPVSRKGSKAYPAPAYGVVAVTNAAGGGIPLSRNYGTTEVPHGSTLTGKYQHAFMKHTPWLEVTGGTMTFKPWVLVVKVGQPVRLYNEDSMAHAFSPGHYPVMYQDHQAIRFYHYSFTGFLINKSGGHRVMTFHLPGIHHVYCIIHSYPWKHTYKSRSRYGGYPYVMDAVIFAEPEGASR